MKLTKEQRHIAYIIMWEEAENPGQFFYLDLMEDCISTQYGFCAMIRMVFDDSFTDCDMSYVFPELFAKRPSSHGFYWFPRTVAGWGERIKLLDKCIKETF